ncbi:hypothetical protein SDJN02_05242 [Cucurbita argyrosperma subsp. argyrosperma]|nr:hypothetical protein SDJN02_05242 [Cucurbita argyrosperma subsp. argyrosperma]
MEMEDMEGDNKVEGILQGIKLRLLLTTLHQVRSFIFGNVVVLIRLGSNKVRFLCLVFIISLFFFLMFLVLYGYHVFVL